MRTIAVADASVLVVAEGETEGARNHARGHLFEIFVGRLFEAFGYDEPTRERLNVTANGIELDLKLTHRLSRKTAIVECKAYSSAVKAGLLTSFYGKFSALRRRTSDLHAFMVVVPRLTPEAQEFYDSIAADDPDFTVLNAHSVYESLIKRGIIVPYHGDEFVDPTIIVSADGVYSAAIELGDGARAGAVVIRSTTGLSVPESVLTQVAETEFANGLEVRDWHGASEKRSSQVSTEVQADAEDFIAVVNGSSTNFEYQLPASPQFFVGRRDAISQVDQVLDSGGKVFVLNAQSGWGKSSLALRIKKLAEDRDGTSLVVDTRTVATTRFVSSVLRRFAEHAQTAGAVQIASRQSWASLASSLRTLSESVWARKGPLVLIFDQFENVFRDEVLTRQFRDLALGVQEYDIPLVIGFAWKTDYVGWTEGYPYQLRDEIRGAAEVVSLRPWGPRDVETLLRRLEREADQRLSRELRQRLREYSQGLPWLFKKLAGHLLREVKNGATQEQLLAEALNVQSLFEADLAELTPHQRDALKYIARYAPVNVTDAMDRVSADVVQSLINRRLIVSVGERLDTYWDIFRDFVTSGRVPIEDSYILRQAPVSVARLIREIERDGGDSFVPEIATRFGTSENAVWNLVRELRLMGISAYAPNRVGFVQEVRDAQNLERAVKSKVAQALRRHRAYSSFVEAAERSGGKVSFSALAKKLQGVFPAVEVSADTWVSYARVFAYWFEVAGLAVIEDKSARLPPEGYTSHTDFISKMSRLKTKGAFPTSAPGPGVRLLVQLSDNPRSHESFSKKEKEALRDLARIGAIEESESGYVQPSADTLVVNGELNVTEIEAMIRSMPGGQECWDRLLSEPSTPPLALGEILNEAYKADWSALTMLGNGKYFRAWARVAGLPTKLKRQSASRSGRSSPAQTLFDQTPDDES